LLQAILILILLFTQAYLKKRIHMTEIIAEIGVNHNGSLEMAKRLIDKAVECKVDTVKFQIGDPANFISPIASKAHYQKQNTGIEETQLDMVKKLVLKPESYRELNSYCKHKGVSFLATPFDKDSVNFLSKDLSLNTLKIASGEITNYELLYECAQTNKNLIISTGMSTLSEIRSALNFLMFCYLFPDDLPSTKNISKSNISNDYSKVLGNKVTLLHCTTEYPAPFESINLNAMTTLQETFGLSVGFSDHSLGIEAALAAIPIGAKIIEKHFTLDKNLPGPDHTASLTPDELEKLVIEIRKFEKILGSTEKKPHSIELENIEIVRRSIFANGNIKKGDFLTNENIICKRPSTGICSSKYWDLIGTKAVRNFVDNEQITY